MIKRKESIGLDWGFKQLKWVKVETLSPSKYRLAFLGLLTLPDEEPKLVSALKDYVLAHGINGAPVALSLQDDSLQIRRLELPRMPPEDLKEALRWQMRDIAEGSMDDYSVRYSVVEETTLTDNVRLMLLGYAMNKKVVKNRIQLLQRAGLKPFFVEPTPVSMAYALEHVYPSSDKWVACIDIGWKKAYFSVSGNSKLTFVKHMTGVNLEQANSLKEGYSQKLALEIQNALDTFSIAYHVEKLEKIFIGGGGAELPNLTASLSKNLGVTAEILNPLQGLEQLSQFPLATQKPYLFGPAVAAAFYKHD